MASGITLKQTIPANIDTPPSGEDNLFFDNTGAPGYKDSTGTSHSLGGPAGPTGPPGPVGNTTIGVDGESTTALAVTGITGNPGPTGASGASGPIGPVFYSEDGEDGAFGPPAFLAPSPSFGFITWSLIGSHVFAGETHVDYTDLGNYNDLLVMLVGVTQTSSSDIIFRYSVDNGANFKSNSSDYNKVTGVGGDAQQTSLFFFGGSSATARSGFLQIQGLRIAAPKHAHGNFFGVDGVHFQYLNRVAGDINAIRVLTAGAGNMNGGTLYVYGR